MKNNVSGSFACNAIMCALLAGSAIAARAESGAVGGQYHIVPSGQDVQYLTLRARKNSWACSAGPNESKVYALDLVDEFGITSDAPFRVPSTTLFLLTDVQMAGTSSFMPLGTYVPTLVPTLRVYSHFTAPVDNSYAAKAYVLAPPLLGVKDESFQATRSFATGVAFAANNYLCVGISARDLRGSSPQDVLTLGDEGAGTNSNTLTAQGILITNYRQGVLASEPRFNW
jgi:hypothetical protein